MKDFSFSCAICNNVFNADYSFNNYCKNCPNIFPHILLVSYCFLNKDLKDLNDFKIMFKTKEKITFTNFYGVLYWYCEGIHNFQPDLFSSAIPYIQKNRITQFIDNVKLLM